MQRRCFLFVPLLAAACSDPDGTEDEVGETSSSESDSDDPSDGEDTTGTTDTTDTTSTSSTDTTETTAGDCVSPPVPASPTELLEWLETGEYTTWQAESGPHASTGPHFGAVRTFVDPCLAESLDVDNTTHPMGAAAVKELYGEGDVVLGWSVMIKVSEGDGGDTWYWHENYDGSTYADEIGSGLCTPCHGGPDNVDFFLSPWPLQ